MNMNEVMSLAFRSRKQAFFHTICFFRQNIPSVVKKMHLEIILAA